MMQAYPNFRISSGKKVIEKGKKKKIYLEHNLRIVLKTWPWSLALSTSFELFLEKVIEIRPRVDWDKGRALQYLLDTLGFDTSNNVLPMYIGDDKTDEDAFKVWGMFFVTIIIIFTFAYSCNLARCSCVQVIRRIGQGFPIVVSSTPKQTKAAYSLREPTEVMSFLIRLVKWKRSVSSSKFIA